MSRQLHHWPDAVANNRAHASTQRVVLEYFQEERPSLLALPAGCCDAVLRQ